MTHPKPLTLTLGLLLASTAHAGNLDSPAPPNDPSGAMYRLEDLYQRLDSGAAGAPRTTPFLEPADASGSTGHTLNQVMDKAPAVDEDTAAGPGDVKRGKTFWGLQRGTGWGPQTGTYVGDGSTYEAGVPRTGQTYSTGAGSGDDGDLQKGVAWPDPRFTDNGDGTVTDNLTGLIWLKQAECLGVGQMDWEEGLVMVATVMDGVCGLSDGSKFGDWRIPNIRELSSLIDYGFQSVYPSYYSLPQGHPFLFTSFGITQMASSTTVPGDTSKRFSISLKGGAMNTLNWEELFWPVRGGQ